MTAISICMTRRSDLALQGDPKKWRLLRLRSPITLHGTLLHPAVGIKADKLAEQVAVAAALSTLLTPVAAAIAFIDPGLAKNKDCSSVTPTQAWMPRCGMRCLGSVNLSGAPLAGGRLTIRVFASRRNHPTPVRGGVR